MLFIHQFLKFFVLLTPFFALSAFLTLTADLSSTEKRATVKRIMKTVTVTVLVFAFAGQLIFDLFGITLDAFRIGAGSILFVSALRMTLGLGASSALRGTEDIAVVPISIPIIVGPGTIGAIMVLGAQTTGLQDKALSILALLCAVFATGALLAACEFSERIFGKQGITILSKLTGLFVSAIAVQIMMTGVLNLTQMTR